jgi:hypothetical protein
MTTTLPNKIGQKTAAESMPVVLASDSGIVVDTTGLATDTGQAATNTKLDTILTRLSGSLLPVAFDFISYTDGGATETYVYKTGGSGGTTVKTVTVTYTDTTKAVLSTIAAV